MKLFANFKPFLALYHCLCCVIILFFYFFIYPIFYQKFSLWEEVKEDLYFDIADDQDCYLESPDFYQNHMNYLLGFKPKYRKYYKTPLDTLFNRVTKEYL